MIIKPRLIVGLGLISGEAVKTKSFRDPRYLGDPINITRLLSHFEVDEMIVIDFSNRFDKDRTSTEILEGIVKSAFMPISFGGGISTFDDAKKVFDLGFDKVVLKSALNGCSSGTENAT